MDTLFLLYIVSVTFAVVTGQVQVEPEVVSYPGQTVNLNCAFTSNTTVIWIQQVTWMYLPKDGPNSNIAVFVPNLIPSYPASPVKGRITFSPSPPNITCPFIQISDVRLTDEGKYICQYTTYPDGSEYGITSLVMLKPITNVSVSVNQTNLMEFISSVSLSCSTPGSSPSFLWLNGSSEVTAGDRVQLTDGNSTLTIVSVTRYDQGPFRCHVFNNFSNYTSDPVNLSISFGPENIQLTISPSQEYYEEGSNINLSCSAVSRPAAQFQWFLNGDLLNDTGPELRLMNIQEIQNGNYTCQVFNNKTMRNKTSQPSVIPVLKKIANASLTSSSNQPSEGNVVNLTCEAAGSVFARKWMKDDSALNLNGNMMLYYNNTVLSFQPLIKTDSGKYTCKISNPISSDECEYIMAVNYGPENVQITGPSKIYLTQTFTLICTAESKPLASYSWKLNETELLNNSAVFTKHNAEPSDSGSYTCQVMNNRTGRTSSVVHGLSVTVEQPSGWSAGYITGIVIACCVFVAACAVVANYVYKRKNKIEKSGDTGTRTGDGGQNNESESGSQELNYANVTFFQNNGGRVQLGLQNNLTEYDQVKVINRPSAAMSPLSYEAHMQRMKAFAPQSGANGVSIYAEIRTT